MYLTVYLENPSSPCIANLYRVSLVQSNSRHVYVNVPKRCSAYQMHDQLQAMLKAGRLKGCSICHEQYSVRYFSVLGTKHPRAE